MSDEEVVAEIVDAQQAFNQPPPSETKKTSKILLFLIPILLSLLGLAIGAAIGGVGYLTAQKGYESQIKVLLTTDSENGKPIPHQELIASRLMIETLLNRERKLENLESFRDMPSRNIAGFIQEHLIVESEAEDDSILTLRLIAKGKTDPSIVLNNLFYVYEKYLNDKREADPSEVSGNPDSSAPRLIELLEAAQTGEYRVRYPISGIVYRALIGLAIGFFVGVLFSLVIK